MRHPFIARHLNAKFRRAEVEPLSAGTIDYVDSVVRGLHEALQKQAEPTFYGPEHPVEGWCLTTTHLTDQGEFMGIPMISVLGHRAVYLSTRPTVMQRVITAPSPRKAFEDRVIEVRRTSVPALLSEDPTLYYGLLNGVDDTIRELGLDHEVGQPPISPDSI